MSAYDWLLVALFYIGVGNSFAAPEFIEFREAIVRNGRSVAVIGYVGAVLLWPFRPWL